MRLNPRSDGRIVIEEFMNYYQVVSATIDNDEYFSMVMNNSWSMTGGTTFSTGSIRNED